MTAKKLLVQGGILLCKGIVFLYDAVTIVLYCVIDRPWRHWKLRRIVWSKLERENDPHSSYVRKPYRSGIHREGVYTMSDLFRYNVAQYANQPCYGVREILTEEKVMDKSGKVITKLSLGDYKWMTYREADIRTDEVSRGLLSIGIKPRKPVVLFAETRVEWLLTAQACFRINVPVVTLYATLGDAGLVHGINETEVTHIITSSGLLPKLLKVIKQTTRVSQIIYMESTLRPDVDSFPNNVQLMAFSELIASGKNGLNYLYDHPAPDDLAILMYTSGSTGIPKGVLISHKNFIHASIGFDQTLSPSALKTHDNYNRYIAYLPQAHVFELISENHVLCQGIPVGFSSPQTLTDTGVALKEGCQGDLKVLRPTILVVVPLMLDRLKNAILTLAGPEGTFSREIFDFAIKYKIFWLHKGFRTRILDRLLLKKCRDSVGGKLNLVVSGGALISPDTQDFIRACLGVKVTQGYGMTETTAAGSAGDVDDFSSGRIGAPEPNLKFRLADWDEGGYRATDVPHPRGEIVIGGDAVAQGYYKRDALTKECFRKENGISWFYTGDIGEAFPDGTFKIIDRKTDLVKLQLGEYVALGKIESLLKTYPLVENICVIGNGMYNYLVALVSPNQQHLSALSKELGKTETNFVKMCQDHDVEAIVTSKMREYGKKCGLLTLELPVKIKLCSEEWIPDNGLVTAALKIRRKEVQQYYKEVIEDMLRSISKTK